MINDIKSFQEAGIKIENLLRLSSYPLAIKLIKSETEVPENSKTPQNDLNTKNFLCQNFKIARSYGWTMTVMNDDCVCKLARLVYGWDSYSEEMADWGHQFNIGLYSKDLTTSKKLENELFYFKNEYKGLVISPLTRTSVIPDVIQIYCLPAQAMRLIQAYLYMEGGVMTFSSAGRIGSCHEGVIKTMLTKKPQLVVLGNGDRVWGGADDSEVMFSLPADGVSQLIEGLEKTHQAGLRYPIPKYMNYQPGFQKPFEKRAKKRSGGTLVKENQK